MKQLGWRRTVKRMVDIAAAGVGLAAGSPIMLATGTAIQMTMGSPVLLRQERPGQKGETFVCLKFRTMTNERDAEGNLLPDEDRITALGQMLRSTSIDELPQLFNVMRGEMSLIGPRPLLIRYLDRYTPDQARRHDVLPGITGWAQINGRNTVSWPEKFALDNWYVDHWSLWLDAMIILRTVSSVVKRDGISAEGQATMSEFMGT